MKDAVPGRSWRSRLPVVLAALAVLVVAVGSLLMTGVLGQPRTRPSQSPTASTGPSPTAPATSPIAIDCALPVLIGAADWRSPGLGPHGWLDVTSGAVVRDPASAVLGEETTAGQPGDTVKVPTISTVAQPRLRGLQGPLFYSLAAGRWLPAPRSAIAPDGLSYAYTLGALGFGPPAPTALHIVDARTGLESVYDLPQRALHVVEYLADAVYLTWSYEGTDGLWRFDLATHALVKLSDRSPVWATDGNVLWTGSANPAGPIPPQGPGAWPDQVDRVDLRTGASETWLYRPQSSTSVEMTDAAGHPVVWIDRGREVNPGLFVHSGEGELVLVDAPGHAITLHAGLKTDVQPGAVDDRGMWLGGTDGVFLLTPKGDFTTVSTAAAVPAGGCH